MTQKNIKEILKSVIILPLSFVILVFLVLYILLQPYFAMATSALNLVSTSTTPTFGNELDSIFIQPSTTEETQQIEETSSTPSDEEILDEPVENIDDTHDTVDISVITMPKYEQHYANLSIPSVEINCNLYYGDSDAVLKKGAGQFMGSRLPGFGSPILVAAHNTSYFRALEWVEIDSIVQIETSYGTYKYKIYETKITKYNDETAYDLGLEKELLILYTCYPFGSLGYKSDRLFIYAEKVSGPVVNW